MERHLVGQVGQVYKQFIEAGMPRAYIYSWKSLGFPGKEQ